MGRLYDFSHAGCGGGYATKPSFNTIIDITKTGVTANDNSGDLDAINAIISAA